jgi:hypothetical protein
MDQHRYLSILRGNFNNIPKKKSKTVRIFLSSTFSGIQSFITRKKLNIFLVIKLVKLQTLMLRETTS